MLYSRPRPPIWPKEHTCLSAPSQTAPTIYDEVPYPGKFYGQTSPERMATLATFFGLDPAPVDRCRVLELGCGDGGNLLPYAYGLPASQFVGVDLSPAAIEHARRSAAALGLRNTEFRAQDLMAFTAEGGPFDYIIAHGLYSWVPEAVREQVFRICRQHLAPQGLAYISYNTLPGGYLRKYARDLLLFHTRPIADPATRIAEAHKVLNFVMSAQPEDSAERELLSHESQAAGTSDPFLFHDILADINDPMYFLDFVAKAGEHGLQYLAEAGTHGMRTSDLPDAVRQELHGIADRLVREQYIDFIRCRRFRHTVLCRSGLAVREQPPESILERFLIAAPLHPSKPLEDIHAPGIAEFNSALGARLTCDEPVPKAIALELGHSWPRALTLAELKQRVCRRVGCDRLDAETDIKVAHLLMYSYLNGVVELHVWQPEQRALDVSERPVASAVARMTAATATILPTLCFDSFRVDDPLALALLPLLDGTRDLETLAREVRARVQGEEVDRIDAVRVRQSLQVLAQYNLLLA